jgi:succinyl-diaminopimelate desuccinylase
MQETEKISRLADIIAIETVGANETRLANYFLNFFQSHGIPAQLVADNQSRANLVAEIGTGEQPVLAFAGHADTVHEGDTSTWQHAPFALTADGKRLYGRGTTDMKGGLIGFAIAMVELHEKGLPKRGTIRFVMTMDEERTAAGAKLLVDRGYLDDVAAMIIAEPTGVPVAELEDYFNSGGAVIAPDVLAELQQKLTTSHAAEQHFIFFAHKGFLGYSVTATGKAAHSSMPKLGVNAIDHLIQYYEREKALYANLPEHSEILGDTLWGPDVIRGGNQPNSVPDSATLTELTRIIPELPPEVLINRLAALVAEMNATDDTMDLRLDVEAYDKAVVSNPDNRLVHGLQKLAAEYLNEALPLPTISVSLGTDAGQFIKANPDMALAIVGPGNTTAHQADEYVERATYLAMIDLFKAAALDYLMD